MKNLLLILLLVLSFNSLSQDITKEDINLFSKRGKKTNVYLYSSVDIGYCNLNDTVNFIGDDIKSPTIGLSIGLALNKHFVIGFYFFSNSEKNYNSTINSYLKYNNCGIFTKVRFFPKLPIHFNCYTKGGIGEASYYDNNWDCYYGQSNKNDVFFMIEPGVEAEINIVKFFKISGGISYRLTDDLNLYKTPKFILNSYNANLSFILMIN